MADQANSGSVFCATKKHLCDLFVEAIRQTTKLLNAEMEAVIADRKQLDRYGIAMARALAQCSRAEALYLLHVSEHGCFPANESDELPLFAPAGLASYVALRAHFLSPNHT